MFRFMVFPVLVNSAEQTVKSREGEKNGRIFEAPDHDGAIEQAGMHIPLFEGEQFAVVKVGRVLNEKAQSNVTIGQSA